MKKTFITTTVTSGPADSDLGLGRLKLTFRAGRDPARIRRGGRPDMRFCVCESLRGDLGVGLTRKSINSKRGSINPL